MPSRCPVSSRRLLGGALLALLALPVAAAEPGFLPTSSTPRDFVELAGRGVFLADFGVDGGGVPTTDLWRSDGTVAGTYRLGMCPASCSPQSGFFFRAPDGSQAFYLSRNRRGGTDLWRTDGSPEGTLRLTNLPATSAVESSPSTLGWSESRRELFFLVATPSGAFLWVTDGSPAGTRAVASFGSRGVGEMAVLGDRVLLPVTTLPPAGPDRTELWVSDGTAAGTRALVEVGWSAQSLLAIGERVVFAVARPAAHGECGFTLWASDGTAAGTAPLAPSGTPACAVEPWLAPAGALGVVFKGGSFGQPNLWRTDGTASGTSPVTAFATPRPFNPAFTSLWNAPYLYFVGDDGTTGSEIWRSLGSPESTELVADLCPGACSSQPRLLEAAGSEVLFASGDFFTGYQPWLTDGTAAGTRRLGEAGLGWHALLGGRLVFSGSTQELGFELWGVDLAAGVATPLTSFADQFGISHEESRRGTFGDLALFAALDPRYGVELWRSDGTAAGTYLLANLAADGGVPEAPPAQPQNLTVHANSYTAVFVSWDPVPGADRYVLDVRGVEGALPQEQAVLHSGVHIELPLGTPVSVRVRAENLHGSSPWSEEASGAAFDPGLSPGACQPSDEVLCLQDGRYRVRVHWRNQHAPAGAAAHGVGRSLATPGNQSSGYFWFFTDDNIELIVKLLDGTSVNGFQWAFYGALSDVEYWIVVSDTLTPASRTYHNPPGTICGRGDTAAFAGSRAPSFAATGGGTRPIATGSPTIGAASANAGPCQSDGDTLCLLGGRYEVQVDWRDQHNDQQGAGRSVPFRDLSGFFWFFHPDNIELVVKILDGTTVNGKVWVFYGALSDVGYTLRVRETATGAVAEYVNPPGNICGGADTAAF